MISYITYVRTKLEYALQDINEFIIKNNIKKDDIIKFDTETLDMNGNSVYKITLFYYIDK